MVVSFPAAVLDCVASCLKFNSMEYLMRQLWQAKLPRMYNIRCSYSTPQSIMGDIHLCKGSSHELVNL